MSTERANGKPQVLVIGDLLMDHQYWVSKFPTPGCDETVFDASQSPGGAAANTATALQTQGIPCAFSSRVGDDEDGCQLLLRLQGLGMDLSCMDMHGRTGYTITIIETSGERTMLSYRGGSNYAPKLTDSIRSMLKTVKILYISGYLLQEEAQAAFTLATAHAAKAAGCLVMLDPTPTVGRIRKDIVADVLACADVVFPNRSELLMLSGVEDLGDSIRLLQETVPCVVVKMGDGGARLVMGTNLRRVDGGGYYAAADCTVPAEAIIPIDATGAGDAFSAGFISAVLRDGSPEDWLSEGNKLASKVVACKGAVSCFL